MHPPAFFANTHPGLILMEDSDFENGSLQCCFPLSQALMTAINKASDACGREIDPKEILEQLAGTSIGNALTGDQVGRDGLNSAPILGRGGDFCGERSFGQMPASWALLLLNRTTISSGLWI